MLNSLFGSLGMFYLSWWRVVYSTLESAPSELPAVLDTVLCTSEWLFILSLNSQSWYALRETVLGFWLSGRREAWGAVTNPGLGSVGPRSKCGSVEPWSLCSFHSSWCLSSSSFEKRCPFRIAGVSLCQGHRSFRLLPSVPTDPGFSAVACSCVPFAHANACGAHSLCPPPSYPFFRTSSNPPFLWNLPGSVYQFL